MRFMLFCGLLAVCAGANAAPITFTVDGTVGSVTPNLSGAGVAAGDPFSMTYTFESTTAPRAGSNSSFAVFDALTSLSFTAGAASGSSSSASEIQVDNAPGAPNDRYAVVSRASQGLTGPTLNGLGLNFASFRLDDLSNTVFSNALTLPTSLSFSSFTSGSFFVFYGPNLDGLINGNVTDIRTATAVPEPTTLTLMGLGLAGIALARRRRLAV